jgi:hypothetical protein
MLRWNHRSLGHVASSHAPGAVDNSALPGAKNPAPGFNAGRYLYEEIPAYAGITPQCECYVIPAKAGILY